MKEQIKKVLNMSKAGTISEEQAAQLIDELMKKQSVEDQAAHESSEQKKTADKFQEFVEENPWMHRRRFKHRHCHGHFYGGRGFKSFLHQKLNDAMEGNFFGSLPPGSNSINMSHVEKPSGNGEDFANNVIHMASVTDVHLGQSSMKENKIDASKLQDIRLQDSDFSSNQISASSMTDLELDKAKLRENRILGVKLHDVQIRNGSLIEKLELNGCVLKDIELDEKAEISGCTLNDVAMNDVKICCSNLKNSQFHHSEIKDVSIVQSHFDKVLARAFTIDDSSFADSYFTEVMFKTTDSWSFRKRGFFDVKFENCRFEKSLFSNCRFVDVVIRNVDFKDLKITDVQISDQVIDGNEAFLKAIGQGKKEHVS